MIFIDNEYEVALAAFRIETLPIINSAELQISMLFALVVLLAPTSTVIDPVDVPAGTTAIN
jgi:hypothetical protein